MSGTPVRNQTLTRRKYVFVRRISKSGKYDSGETKAAIMVPKPLAERLVGRYAIITVEILDDYSEDNVP